MNEEKKPLNKQVLIMAGGTGGHVYPALTLANEMHKQGYRVSWLGTDKGVESRVVDKTKFPFFTINISGARRSGILRLVTMPWQLAQSFWQSFGILRKVKPQLVIGMGGYVSGPGAIAAWILRIPLVIHEQNAIPGFTNRILSKFASKTLESFPNSFKPSKNIVTTGNPVRQEILTIQEPATRFAQRDSQKFHILILGGSQGALSINQIAPTAITHDMQQQGVEIWHQAGEKHVEAVTALYKRYGLTARVDAFIDDMAKAYTWADLVIGRAGATTVSELTAAGVGSILIPYPYAVDDHQTHNAKFLQQADGAILLPHADFSATKLNELLLDFLQNRRNLMTMAIAARRMVTQNATQKIFEQCIGACRDK